MGQVARRFVEDQEEETDTDSSVAATSQLERELSNIQLVTMAKVNRPVTESHLNIIPEYSGDPSELLNFVNVASQLHSEYTIDTVVEAKENHWLLFQKCMNKLNGAAKQVAHNNECSTIPELISVLKNNFADSRSVPQLMSELINMRSYSHEHPIQFLNRLVAKRTTIVTKYKLENVEGQALQMLLAQLDTQSVNVLCNGIPTALGVHLQTLQIKDLNDARSKLINNSHLLMKQLGFNTDMTNLSTNTNKSHKPNSNNFQQKQIFQNKNRIQNFQKPQDFSRQQGFNQRQFNQGYQNQFQNFNQNRQNQYQNFNQNRYQNFNQNQHQYQNSKASGSGQFRQQFPNDTDVSMRTVSTNPKFKAPIHTTETDVNFMDEKDRIIAELNERIHFLEVGQPNNNPD